MWRSPGLTPSAEYVYRVGDGGSFISEEKSFTAANPQRIRASSDSYSDPQSESVENYMSFRDCIEQALEDLPEAGSDDIHSNTQPERL